MAAAEGAAKLAESLTCALCSKLFTNPHSFSTCGHTFCYTCVLDTLEGPGISKSECPTCRQPAWKNDLHFNHVINNTVEHVAKLHRSLQRRAAKKKAPQRAQHGAPVAGAAAAAAQLPAAAAEQQHKHQNQHPNQQHQQQTAAGVPLERRPGGGRRRRSRLAPEEGQEPLPQPQGGAALEEEQQAACVPLEQAGAEVEAAQPEGSPSTPELQFGPAWQAKMLALPTPAAEELAALRREVELLEAALRLCDEVQCMGEPAWQPGVQQPRAPSKEEAGGAADSPAAGAARSSSPPLSVALAAGTEAVPVAAKAVPSAPAAVGSAGVPPASGWSPRYSPTEEDPAAATMLVEEEEEEEEEPGSSERSQPGKRWQQQEQHQAGPPAGPAVQRLSSNEDGEQGGRLRSHVVKRRKARAGVWEVPAEAQQQQVQVERQPVEQQEDGGMAEGSDAVRQALSGHKRSSTEAAEAAAAEPTSSGKGAAAGAGASRAEDGSLGHASWAPPALAGAAVSGRGVGSGRDVAGDPYAFRPSSSDSEEELRRLQQGGKPQASVRSRQPQPAPPIQQFGRRKGGPGMQPDQRALSPEQYELEQRSARDEDNSSRHNHEPPAAGCIHATGFATAAAVLASQQQQEEVGQEVQQGWQQEVQPAPEPPARPQQTAPLAASGLASGPRVGQPSRQQSSQKQQQRAGRSILDLFKSASQAEGSEASSQARSMHDAPADAVKHVVVSGGSAEAAARLEQLRDRLGGCVVQNNVNEHTTHVLVGVNAQSMLTQRSIKSFAALARGAWLVSTAWLDACLQAGDWVPEAAYEARGEQLQPGAPVQHLGGPKRNRMRRLARSSPLFEGLRLHVAAPPAAAAAGGGAAATQAQPTQAQATQRGHLEKILELAGAEVVLDEAAAAADRDVVVLLGNWGKAGASVEREAALLKARLGRRVLSMSWVYESLAAGELQSKGAYWRPSKGQ